MMYVIKVNSNPMTNSDKVIYEFSTVMEAIKMVNICYGLSSLKSDVEICEWIEENETNKS